MKRILLLLTLILLAVPEGSLAHPGWGLVMDSKGNIFFCDVNRNVIWKVDVRGKVTRFVAGKHSHMLALDANDNIYGEHVEYDSRNDRWLSHRWKADSTGHVSRVDSKELDYLYRPRDHRGDEYLFVSDAHKKVAFIRRVTIGGDTVIFAGGIWGDTDGKGNQARFRNFGPSVLADSAFFVGSGGILRKITLDGVVTTLAGPRDGFGDPDEPGASGFLGIACDEEHNTYAAHWRNGVVIKITPAGDIRTILQSGMLWMPTGVLVVGKDLYVLEHRAGITGILEKAGFGGPRVRKLSPDGKITIVGSAP